MAFDCLSEYMHTSERAVLPKKLYPLRRFTVKVPKRIVQSVHQGDEEAINCSLPKLLLSLL